MEKRLPELGPHLSSTLPIWGIISGLLLMGSIKGKVWAANKIECKEPGELNRTRSVLRSLQATREKSLLHRSFQGASGSDLICKEAPSRSPPRANTASCRPRLDNGLLPSPAQQENTRAGWLCLGDRLQLQSSPQNTGLLCSHDPGSQCTGRFQLPTLLGNRFGAVLTLSACQH